MQHRGGGKVSEIYPLHNVQCIVDALHSLNHEVIELEGDAGLCNRSQDFFGEILMMFGLDWVYVVFFAKMPEYLTSMCALVFNILTQKLDVCNKLLTPGKHKT